MMAAREEKAHDETPAEIEDHAFVPRGQWWSLCKVCGLAQAAHAETTIDTVAEMHADHKRQREWREAERRRVHEGGRVRIGYVGDDFPDEDA